MKRLLFILAAALLVLGPGAEAADTPIRFGLTAAVVRENLDLYERWAAYLGRKVGRPVQFVQRRTYREAMEMLETGDSPVSSISMASRYVRRCTNWTGRPTLRPR